MGRAQGPTLEGQPKDGVNTDRSCLQLGSKKGFSFWLVCERKRIQASFLDMCP